MDIFPSGASQAHQFVSQRVGFESTPSPEYTRNALSRKPLSAQKAGTVSSSYCPFPHAFSHCTSLSRAVLVLVFCRAQHFQEVFEEPRSMATFEVVACYGDEA